MKSAPVQWENGIFLAPQVFQQSERYLEAQLRLLRRSSRALSFGVIEVGLDSAALALGKLRLSSCQAVLPPPDGATIDVPQVDAPPPERDFVIPTGAQSITVYLTLPALNAPGRTQGREETLTDVYDSNRSRPVKLAQKALSLAVSGDPLTNLTSLKIAEIERHAQTGKPVLSGSFIPTCLVISAAPGLLQLVRAVLTRSEGMLRDLPAARKQGRTMDFLFLSALQQHVPALRHLVEDAADHTHPVQLYEALLRLAGALQAFSDTPQQWPRYDHERPERCFPPLCRILDSLLGNKLGPVDRKFVLERKSKDTSIWRGRLDPLPAPETRVLLALRGENLSAGPLITGLPQSGKLAAGTKIVRAIEEATFAIPLRHETRLPERLLAQPGIYYAIDINDNLFAEVRKCGEIAAFIPADLRGDGDLTVEVIYVGEGGMR